MRKIETKNSERKKQLIKKIIVWAIIAIILGLILTAALGNLDAIKTLWKTP
jgi:hypothetical protein